MITATARFNAEKVSGSDCGQAATPSTAKTVFMVVQM